MTSLRILENYCKYHYSSKDVVPLDLLVLFAIIAGSNVGAYLWCVCVCVGVKIGVGVVVRIYIRDLVIHVLPQKYVFVLP